MNVITAITVMTTPNVLTLQVVTGARAKQAILEMEEPALVSYSLILIKVNTLICRREISGSSSPFSPF